MNKRGYSMVELLLVMLLLCMFGVTVAALTQAGTGAYRAINDNTTREADARTALSYITVRIKQSDAPGMVYMGQAYNTPALVIRETFGGISYNTWIFFINGELREAPYLDDGAQPSPANSELIARAEGFSVGYDETSGCVTTAVQYRRESGETSEVLTLEGSVHMRAGDVHAL